MKIKAIHIVALAVLGVTAIPLVSARPAHRLQAVAQLGLPPEKVTCQYCHVAANGRAPWNAFGENIRTIWNADGNKVFADSLYLTLKARQDSDGDGYDDILEVVAWTQPGNKDSKPNVSKDTLEAELKAWGGVEQYKAKK